MSKQTPRSVESVPEENAEPPAEAKNPSKYNLLSETPLYFRETWHGKTFTKVPSPTPQSAYEFERAFPTIPEDFPKLDDLKLPLVRQAGVKRSIEILAGYFGCNDYQHNLLQFWFLDVVTDCLWKAQDEFRFPVESQKTVLGWVLYVIELIRGGDKNFSRKKLFGVFKEAILVAGELVDEGHLAIPMPKDVFSLIEDDNSSHSCFTNSTSSLSIISSEADNVSYLEMKVGEEPDVYLLPKETCNCDNYRLSSIDTLSESATLASAETTNSADAEIASKITETEEVERVVDLQDVDFYKPDMSMPSRFLPLQKEVEIEKPVSAPTPCLGERDKNEITYDLSEASGSYELVSNSELLTESVISCPSTLFSAETQPSSGILSSNLSPRSQTEKVNVDNAEQMRKIQKSLQRQKLLEQRMRDMDDPNVGWLPYGEDKSKQPQDEDDSISNDSDWFDVIEDSEQETTRLKENALYNFGVLWAVIDFVFSYFYESFQFTLIKLAFQACPGIITQKLNDAWKVPKLMKEELKKPAKKKEKKEKKKKEKKSKKGKSSKKSKKSKKSKSKKSKKSKKGSKKSKGKKKKGKKKKLTKEEKAELERQRRERERIEEELRKLEENRRFMFPLGDAASDELFKSLFENWVKVEPKKGKTDKKGKKDKKKKGKKKK